MNRSRCIKEQNITIKIEKCAEGVNEVMLFDEVFSGFFAGMKKRGDTRCSSGEEATAL
jgi:hypothetical protein